MKYYITKEQLERLGKVHLLLKREIEIQRIDDEEFEIASVCKDDLGSILTKKQLNSLNERDMKRIASEMADTYYDNGFWEDMEMATNKILEEKEAKC